MTKVWLDITSWIKFNLIMLVVYIPLMMFLGVIGVVISGLLFLGSFPAAMDDMRKRFAKKQTRKIAAIAKYEFEGFEQALLVTQREIKLL